MHRIAELSERAKVLYDNGDPGHDFSHVLRVLDNCRRISASLEINHEFLEAAALLHDIVNLPKNHPERSDASKKAALKSREILRTVNFDEDEIDAITKIIEEHSYSKGLKPTTLESAVLQDADKLDALGAVGIMRLVSTGTKMNSSFYNILDPYGAGRELDDKSFVLDHIEKKLMKLPELMNTEIAKLEAKTRIGFIKEFVRQIRQEIPKGL